MKEIRYGTEIAETLLDIGFNQFKLHMREHMWFKGSWRDSLLYAILEDEYE